MASGLRKTLLKMLGPKPEEERGSFLTAPAEHKPEPKRAEEIARYLRALDVPDEGGRNYLEKHMPRLVRTMTIVPEPGSRSAALELGCYMQMAPVVHGMHGYRRVRGAYMGPMGRVDTKIATQSGREVLRCEIDLFDAERDRFPYRDGEFDLVLACEIIEHMAHDPMHLLLESSRVLAEDGALIVTTPNVASIASLVKLLHGKENPQIFALYQMPEKEEPGANHVREYTVAELSAAVTAAGFSVEEVFTERIEEFNEFRWAFELLQAQNLPLDHRGEQTYLLARKRGSLPIDRYPYFLYQG